MRQTKRTIMMGLIGLAAMAGPALAGPFQASAEGGPRVLEVTGVKESVNMREEARPKASVIAKVPLGTRLSNFGCMLTAGKVWCDVQPLAGGPRGYVQADFIKPGFGRDGQVATGDDDSAERLGAGKVDATGRVPCAENAGQPMGQCNFRVARGTGGWATIEVSLPSGSTRTIFFMDGRALAFSSSQADGSAAKTFTASREDDLNRIKIGDERYEIPDAAVFGG